MRTQLGVGPFCQRMSQHRATFLGEAHEVELCETGRTVEELTAMLTTPLVTTRCRRRR